MKAVYISDLDGTLLNQNAALSTWSRETLCELLDDGLPFTVASARSVVSMRQMLQGLKLKLPVIEFNGAFISDLESGHHQIINSIQPTIVENLYHLICAHGHVPFVSSFNGTQDCLYYNQITNDGMQWYLNDRLQIRDERLRRIEDLSHTFRDKIICLTIIGEQHALLGLEHIINDVHGDAVETHCYKNLYSPDWYWLTIHDRRATKDRAIKTVLGEFGLNECELVVFGDQNNDIKMFQLADRAIAVSNAIQELKEHATQIIGSNQEDSVVKFICDDWKNRRPLTIA